VNAYELADDVKNISNTIEALEWVQKATPLLRQQADRIAELEKCLFQMQNACIDLTKNTEPVAWMDKNDPTIINLSLKWVDDIPLYTTPQIKELSDEHLKKLKEINSWFANQRGMLCRDYAKDLARIIVHLEKND